MNMLELSGARFSARKYTNEAVSKQDLDYILECVRLAPSACNRQPWKFILVKSEEAKTKLRECYNRDWFTTAPMYIICMKNPEENWIRKDDDKAHGDIDLAIATEHLCLAAAERGLGTCWVWLKISRQLQSFLLDILPTTALVQKRNVKIYLIFSAKSNIDSI